MPGSIRRLLCCLGLRDDCHQVLSHSLCLAQALGAELHVLHAVKSLSDDVMNTLKANIRQRQTLEGLMEQRLDQARGRLDDFLDEFWTSPMSEIPSRELIQARAVVEGYPAAEIIRYATRHDCDMIVMAANKRGFAASWAGKVTKGVVKRSSVPVVVVPPV
ncbi:hypothetical protein HCU01_26770 [Halomonas cupida]|uniref:Nucleotide-binding universal stress protein, UspA family n=1 Tax=Halomonas cupida TaxID=44933 RepID=A0A1M7C314_9GAMM|nr:universal stress protein [Halomonas cupida]GEN24728.1 hypothetical protein HCU01_26770 [Halomonas cupida]SHL61678.1 Nucleotide-binding universal stress protein, UspA family [Halomonas cupida]